MRSFKKIISQNNRWILLLVCFIFTAFGSSQALALSSSDLQSINNDTVWYDPNAGSSCGGVALTPSTTLSNGVPQPYRDIIAAGAAKFGADPNIVAAIFAQEHGAAWPASPNGPWASSGAGAQGPMQFLKTTFDSYAVSASGGTPDIQNLSDALYTGAKYIAGLGGKPGTPVGNEQFPLQNNTLLRVAASYNWGGGNVDKAGSSFPLQSLNSETKAYVEHVYTMLSTNFATMPGGSTTVSSASPTTSCYTAGGTCTQGTARQRVVQCLEQELALWTSGQLKPGTDYKKYSNNRPEDWCADFASWVYNQAGYPFGPGGSTNPTWDIAYTGSFMVPPQDGSKFVVHPASGYTPQPGDIALHSDPGNLWYHTNIVAAVNGPQITLIGGNQSAADGGGEYYSRSKVSSYPISGSTDDSIVYYISPGNN